MLTLHQINKMTTCVHLNKKLKLKLKKKKKKKKGRGGPVIPLGVAQSSL
jgi:hypothetical protein